MKPNILLVGTDLRLFGFWYTLHEHGLNNLWTIFCAHKANKYKYNFQDCFSFYTLFGGFFLLGFFLDDSYLTRQVSSASGEIVP